MVVGAITSTPHLFELNEDITGVMHAWSQNSDGYTVELAIAWHLLYVVPKSGLTIGFDLENRDDDDGRAIDGYRLERRSR